MTGRSENGSWTRLGFAAVVCVALCGVMTAFAWDQLRKSRRLGGAVVSAAQAAVKVHELQNPAVDPPGAELKIAEIRAVVGKLTSDSATVRSERELLVRTEALLTQMQRSGAADASSVAGDSLQNNALKQKAARNLADVVVRLSSRQSAGSKLAFGLLCGGLACAIGAVFLLILAFRARAGRAGQSGQETDASTSEDSQAEHGSFQQLLAAAVRSTDEGVLISDTGAGRGEPRIVFMNQSFKSMSGIADKDLIGEPVSLLRESCLREREFSLLEHSYSNSQSTAMETVRWRDDGSKVHCEWHISPVREVGGRVTHFISILRDITLLREQEEARRQSHEELIEVHRKLVENQDQLIQSEKMAFLGQLAAGVAHEINNPVGYVMSNLETLAEDLEGARNDDSDGQSALPPNLSSFVEEAEEILGDSIDGLDRVKDIVQRLKNFARPADVAIEEANINAEIEQAIKIVHNEFANRCEVTTDFADLPPLRCRPGQLNQVFTNLLANAAQAIGDRGEVVVKTELAGPEILVKVSDDGEGIPEENLPRLFAPFFTTKPTGKGTGLGLSVSYGIVQKHSGTIEVESQRGRGSTFTVRLPLEP